MQHWSPEEPNTPVEAPLQVRRDTWTAWLAREPDHVTRPDPRGPVAISAIALMAGVALFWGGAAVLVWRSIA